MASLTPEFRFGNFVASIIVSFICSFSITYGTYSPYDLFYPILCSPAPVDGEVLTPYLFFSMIVDPSRTLPIFNSLCIPPL